MVCLVTLSDERDPECVMVVDFMFMFDNFHHIQKSEHDHLLVFSHLKKIIKKQMDFMWAFVSIMDVYLSVDI